MGLHTKNLDSTINKLIPKEILPSVLSDRIEKSVILEKMKRIEKDMEMCGNCKYWNKKDKFDGINFGYCANTESEYYDSSIAEEDSCSDFEELDA